MAASHFFLGVGAGIAILTIPTVFVAPQLDVAQRIGAWVAGPPREEAPRSLTNDLAGLNRPLRGYVTGQPTPTAEPPPTLQPRVTPEAATSASSSSSAPTRRVEAVPTLPPAGVRTGVIRSGGGGAVYVRRVAGMQSPDDATLPDGSPVLISASSEIQVSGQTWRSVRGLNGVSGWVPSSMVSVDGSTVVASAQAVGQLAAADAPPERAVVANTDGEGVALRASARPDDRLPAGLMDGTVVVVLERSGADMARVRADNGQEGWVPARYLAPAF